MSILEYLTETLLYEGRFGFQKPDSYRYNGISRLGVGKVGDTAISRDTSTISFSIDDRDYILKLLTTVKYEPVLTDNGEIQYEVENDFIIPYFVDENGDKTQLSNDVLNGELYTEVKNALTDQPALVSINREFDAVNSDEKFKTTNAGKPIKKINTTYYVLKNIFIDKFATLHLPLLQQHTFESKYSKFVSNIKYELESITLVAKEDFEGDTRRANLYRRWWKANGSEIGNIIGVDEEQTPDGISFEINFSNTMLN